MQSIILTFTIAAIATGSAAAQTANPAALAKFAGTWIEDQSQRKIGGARHLIFTAGKVLQEHRGSEANPLVQDVVFGTRPYAFEANGRNLMNWMDLGNGKYERTMRDQANKVLTVRHIEITADGKTLTEVTDTFTGPKPAHGTVVHTRVSGAGRTLAGEWKPTSRTSDTPDTLQITSSAAGLVVTGPNSRVEIGVDGKPAPLAGPSVISGSTEAVKSLNVTTMEITQARSGVPTGKTVWTLSPDGRTLTSTATNLAPGASSEPSVTVYRKQAQQ